MKRKELLQVLERVKPGIAAREVVDSMSYFFFSGNNVITYNDQISIQHPLNTDFSLFVKANDIYSILSKLKSEDITLSNKNGKLNIRCKTMNAYLASITDEEITKRINSVDTSLKSAKWKDLPDNFSENTLLCSFISSKKESDQTLTCVLVDGYDCVSSDNKRICHAILNSPIDKMLIKSSEIKNLIAINPTKYAIKKSWLHFKNEDDCLFSIRKIDGEFPDFLQFFDFDGIELNLPKDIIESMDIASVLVDNTDPAITVNISKNFVTVSVKSESGTIQHRSKIDYLGENMSFTINPEFLKQMLIHSSSIIISENKAKLETDDKKFSIVTALYK